MVAIGMLGLREHSMCQHQSSRGAPIRSAACEGCGMVGILWSQWELVRGVDGAWELVRGVDACEGGGMVGILWSL